MSWVEKNRALALRNFRAFDSGDLSTLEETTAPIRHAQRTLFKYPPTGKKVTLQGITIFRVVKGRVAEQWGELNLFSILRQVSAFNNNQRLQE